MHHGVQLPEPEVTGHKKDPFTLRVSRTRTLFALEFDARKHGVR